MAWDTPLLRLGVVLFFALLFVAVWQAIRLLQARRVIQLQRTGLELPSEIRAQLEGASAAILSFSTRTCAECRTRQAPALRRLAERWGQDVRIVAVDPSEHSELVSRLGILTVPATVVLDQAHQVRQINLGYTSDSELHSQLLANQATPALTASYLETS
jgi:Thioredoxin.